MTDKPMYMVASDGEQWVATRDGKPFSTWDGQADPRKPRGILDQVAAVVPAPLGATVRWLPRPYGWVATTGVDADLTPAGVDVDGLVARTNTRAAEKAAVGDSERVAGEAVDRVAAYWRATGFLPNLDFGRADAEKMRTDDPRMFDLFLSLANEHPYQPGDEPVSDPLLDLLDEAEAKRAAAAVAEPVRGEPASDHAAWPQVDPDGARVHTEGANLTVVVLWSNGATETMTAAQLVVRLHHRWAARTAGNTPAHIVRTYVRDGDELHYVVVHERVERDGEQTVTVVRHGPSPGIVAAGTYPAPNARAEQPF